METYDTNNLDPRLEALLDEALSPETVEGGVPADLADRIYGRTLSRLHRRDVLGVLPDRPWVRRIAAGIVLAAGVGIAAISVNIVNDAHGVITVTSDLYRNINDLNHYPLPELAFEEPTAGAQLDWSRMNRELSDALKALDHELLLLDQSSMEDTEEFGVF